MNTIEYYLRQLDFYRKMLISKLRNLGIACDDTEHYNTLVPKIYKLASSGEVVVPSFSLREFDGTEDEVNYIMSHVITTATETDMMGKFYNTPNLKYLDLNKFIINSNTKQIRLMFWEALTNNLPTNGGGTASVENLNASGCDLSYNEGKSNPIDNTGSFPGDLYPNLKTLDLSNTKIGFYRLALFTRVRDVPVLENIDCTNMTYTDEGFFRIFGDEFQKTGVNKYIKNIDMSTVTYEKPFKYIRNSFRNLTELENIDLGNFEFEDVITNYSYSGYVTANNQGFSGLKKLKTLIYPLSKLANKSVDRLEYMGMNACEEDLVFPIVTFTTSSPLLLKNFHKVKKLDLSNVTVSTSIIFLQDAFVEMGYALTDDDLEDTLFEPSFDTLLKDKLVISMYRMCQNNKLVKGDFELSGLKVKPNDSNFFSSTFEGTNIENFKMNNITFDMTATYGLGLSSMCRYCEKLKTFHLELGRTWVYSMSGMLTYCDNLETIFISVDACNKGDTKDEYVSLSSLIGGSDNSYKKTLPKLNTITVKDTRISSIPLIGPIAPNLKNLIFDNCDTKVTNIDYIFGYSESDTINITGFDASYVNSLEQLFYSCPNLVNVSPLPNLGKGFTQKSSIYGKYQLSFGYNNNVSHDSLVGIFNGLYDLNITYGVYDEEGNPGTGKLYTQRILLGSNFNKLTPEEIAIATNKGWTVSAQSN